LGKRLLVTGAGTSASENLLRSLRAGGEIEAIGCHSDRFILRHSSAERRYLVPRVTDPAFGDALRRVLDAERIDLVIPTSDGDVGALSDVREDLGERCFLPDRDTIQLCQDKHDLIAHLRARGVAAPETHLVGDLDALEAVFGRFGGRTPLWCRPRTGTCARGGGAVGSPSEARRWIEMWEARQALAASSFTLSEYLPGREVLCQSLWRDGRLVLANTFERLSYFGVDNIPSGVTSLSSLAKTVVEPAVVDLCRAAVRAVAPHASGPFSIDVKGDGAGAFHVTEINAGRLFMAMTAFDAVLAHSMALTWVRLALGEPVDLSEPYDAVADYYMVRDLDTLPGIYHADELFDGITRVDA
jgi:carbamoyl-phosphate synthase large subunit